MSEGVSTLSALESKLARRKATISSEHTKLSELLPTHTRFLPWQGHRGIGASVPLPRAVPDVWNPIHVLQHWLHMTLVVATISYSATHSDYGAGLEAFGLNFIST